MEFTGVMIVAIVFTSLAVQRYFGHRAEMKKLENASNSAESQKLQHELVLLQERVTVLEKIVTDKGYQLKEEIKNL